MARARYRLNQFPAITVLLLVLLATLPMVKVSSNTDTHDEPRATPAGATAMPAQPHGANAAAIVPPVGPNATTTAQRPVAQLIPPPDDLQSVTFTLDENAMKTSPPRGVALLATARYTTAEHVIVVTTAAASTGGAPLPLGAQRIALTDGTPAWVTTGLTNSAPNEVALVRDGLIVTVASDLPVEMLAALAADVVIRW